MSKISYVLTVCILPLLAAIPPTHAMPVQSDAGAPAPTQPAASSIPLTTEASMPAATAAPAAAGMPSATAPVTPTPAPAAPVAQVVTPTPVAPISTAPKPSVSPDAYKNDLEEINKQLASLHETKATLKKLLTKLDEEVEKGKTLALQTRKKSMEILAQTAPDAAKKIRDEVNQNLDALSKAQQALQSDVLTPFQSAADSMQSRIQAVQASITQLQAKGVALQAAQIEQQPTTAPQAAPQHASSFQSWLFSEKKANEEVKTEKTFVHYLLSRIADLVTGALRILYVTFTTIKDALFGAAPKPPVPAAPTPSHPIMPTAQPQQAAGATPAALTTASTSTDITGLLDAAEKNIIQNERSYQTFWQQTQTLERQAKAAQLTLASNDVVRKQLTNLDQSLIFNLYQPTWKKSIQEGFNSFLDGVIYAYNATYFYITSFYRNFMTPVVHKISADVQDRLKEEQAKVNQSKPQQQPMPAATAPAPTA